MSKNALLIVDVQHGFFTEHTKKCLPRILELAHSGDFDEVIATQFYNSEGSMWRKHMGWDKMTQLPDIALVTEVEEAADYVVKKTSYDGGIPLVNILNDLDVGSVIIVGIDTDACVLSVASTLFGRGFNVKVDLDGCASTGGEDVEEAARIIFPRIIGGSNVIGQ